MGKHSHFASGDPEIQGVIDAILANRKLVLDPEVIRKEVSGKVDAGNNALNWDNVVRGEVKIPVQGGEILAFTYRPKGTEGEKLPILFDFHEGGYFLGRAGMDHALCLALSVGARICVMNVDYRLAPEAPFPTALNDCYTAVKWAAERAEGLKVDLAKGFFICGTSAGANFSAAITFRARDDPSFKWKIRGQILITPTTYSKRLYPLEKYKDDLTSYDEYTNDPIIPRGILDLSDDLYDKPLSKEQMESTDRSPLLAKSLEGLPRAFLAIAGKDPIRDEGILYAELLNGAIGAENVRMVVYPNAFHGFICVARETGAAKKAVEDVTVWLKWVLSST